jgi:N6-adenosine-specific RNA methylase IME4
MSRDTTATDTASTASIPATSTQAVPLDDIIIIPDRMRRLPSEVVDEIAESINKRGLLINPITLRRASDNALVLNTGRHRFEAVRKLGHKTIAAVILDGLDADQARLIEIDENLIRAELSAAERSLHLVERKRLYDKQAQAPKHGGDRKSAKAKSSSQNENLKTFVADTAAKTGKGRSTIAREVTRGNQLSDVLVDVIDTALDRGDELDALAKLPPDEQQKLAERAKAGEKVSAKTRAKQVKRQEREQQLAEQTAAAAIALGQEPPASVIVADPALRFAVRSENGQDRSAENHYPCGSVEEMIALKPPMAADAVVFMWTSAPQLKNSMAILKGWWLEYKTYSGWDKEIDGTGYVCRSRLELILIAATKGSKVPAPAPGEQFPQLFRAKRGKHSEKPDIVYREIERLYPNLIKLEMFARKPRPQWRTWGNEVPTPAEVPPPSDEPALADPPPPERFPNIRKPPDDGHAITADNNPPNSQELERENQRLNTQIRGFLIMVDDLKKELANRPPAPNGTPEGDPADDASTERAS